MKRKVIVTESEKVFKKLEKQIMKNPDYPVLLFFDLPMTNVNELSNKLREKDLQGLFRPSITTYPPLEKGTGVFNAIREKLAIIGKPHTIIVVGYIKELEAYVKLADSWGLELVFITTEEKLKASNHQLGNQLFYSLVNNHFNIKFTEESGKSLLAKNFEQVKEAPNFNKQEEPKSENKCTQESEETLDFKDIEILEQFLSFLAMMTLTRSRNPFEGVEASTKIKNLLEGFKNGTSALNEDNVAPFLKNAVKDLLGNISPDLENSINDLVNKMNNNKTKQ